MTLKKSDGFAEHNGTTETESDITFVQCGSATERPDFHLLDMRYYGKFLAFQGAVPASPSIRKFHMQR